MTDLELLRLIERFERLRINYWSERETIFFKEISDAELILVKNTLEAEIPEAGEIPLNLSIMEHEEHPWHPYWLKLKTLTYEHA